MTRYFEAVWRDVTFAFRQFGRQARFWAVIVVTLVVGIVASTCVFAVVDAVLLKPLPYAEPERLVQLQTNSWRGEYSLLKERATTFDVAAYYPGGPEVTVNAGGEPLRLPAAGVTADLFDVLGVQPALGRDFTLDEAQPGGPGIVGGTYWRTYGVVILSDRIWRAQFGGSESAIGSTLSIDGVGHTIVGVMPPSFAFPSAEVALWFPHNIDPANPWAGNVARQIARLRAGFTLDDARQELRALLPTFRELIPFGQFLRDYGANADVRSLTDVIVGEARPALLLLLAAIGAVLLVVCVNVANLLLARGTARDREFATRAALGAGRRRLVRQLLIENVTMALLAGAMGTLLSVLLLRAIVALLPPDLPRVGEIAVDARVVLFSVGVSGLTGLVFGLLPALRVTRAGHGVLAGGGMRGVLADAREGRLTRILAATQLALAVVLLVTATLLVRSFWNLMAVDPGFRAEQLVAARVAPPGFEDRSYAARHEFAARLLEETRTAPGVAAAAIGNAIPFDAGLFGAGFEVEHPTSDGASNGGFALAWLGVSASYFETMGTAVLQGRPFTAADRTDSPRVAIVSRSVARANWGDESPVGKRIRFRDNRQPEYGGEQLPWFTVVGMVEDVHFQGVARDAPPMLYVPFEQHWDVSSLRMILRSAGASANVMLPLRSVVASLDPLTAVSDVRAFETRVGDTIARPRFIAYLLAAFAALAIFLAAIGVYGVLAYAMSRRIPEIGVRMALGATDHHVFGLLFRQGAAVTAIGIAIGVPLAVAAARLLSGLLFGVNPVSVEILGGVALALLLVGLAASSIPAYRAARIDAMQALRQV